MTQSAAEVSLAFPLPQVWQRAEFDSALPRDRFHVRVGPHVGVIYPQELGIPGSHGKQTERVGASTWAHRSKEIVLKTTEDNVAGLILGCWISQ